MTEQKKAIDMTPEELKRWLASLPTADDEDVPYFYFSNPDPYLKCEPLSDGQPRHNIRFDKNGNICIKNLSAWWIPKLTVAEEISGTLYTVTGSYEGEDSFLRKLERITSKKFTEKLEGHQ